MANVGIEDGRRVAARARRSAVGSLWPFHSTRERDEAKRLASRAVANALCSSGFSGPISVHIEYDVTGATTAEREREVLAAAARDLGVFKSHLRDACSRSV